VVKPAKSEGVKIWGAEIYKWKYKLNDWIRRVGEINVSRSNQKSK
jgi:hypothetical protein